MILAPIRLPVQSTSLVDYTVQEVGRRDLREFWIPAEDLDHPWRCAPMLFVPNLLELSPLHIRRGLSALCDEDQQGSATGCGGGVAIANCDVARLEMLVANGLVAGARPGP